MAFPTRGSHKPRDTVRSQCSVTIAQHCVICFGSTIREASRLKLRLVRLGLARPVNVSVACERAYPGPTENTPLSGMLGSKSQVFGAVRQDGLLDIV